MIKVNKEKLNQALISSDDKECFVAKYWLLKIDYEKYKYKNSFSELDNKQLSDMCELLTTLENQAINAGIDLFSAALGETEDKDKKGPKECIRVIVYDDNNGMTSLDIIEYSTLSYSDDITLTDTKGNLHYIPKNKCLFINDDYKVIRTEANL